MEGCSVTKKSKLESELAEAQNSHSDYLEMSEVKAESDFNHIVNPLEIQEIVENVFKYCNQNDIVHCREVCKLWNDAAIRILAKTPELHLKLHDFNELSPGRRVFTHEILQQFHNLLNESQNPQILFKNVKMSNLDTVYSIRSPLQSPECRNILTKFGKYVKILTIEEDNNFNFMNKCLGQNSYFPNVEVLKLFLCECWTAEMNFPFLDEIGVLKVKELYFNDKIQEDVIGFPGVLAIFSAILQNCHEIDTLHLDTKFKTTHLFIDSLRSVPHITKKLKELYISGNIFDNWKELCEIEFSTKLKTVKLKDSEWSRDNNSDDDGLTTFLTKVSQSLERLELEVNSDEDWINVQRIPSLPKLKKLLLRSCRDYIDRNRKGYSYYKHSDFFMKFPLLRRFHVTEIFDLHQFLESCLEIENLEMISGSSNYVPKFVHQNLEKISIFLKDSEIWQFKIYSPTTINILNTVFPNFSELEIELNPPHGSWAKGEQLWFEEFFSAISKMKNLRILSIVFHGDYRRECRDIYYGILDLKQAFVHLKETPRLEELTIRGLNIEDRKSRWLEHLQALTDAPRIRIISVFLSPPVTKLTNENVIKELQELVEKFAAKNITMHHGHDVSAGIWT